MLKSCVLLGFQPQPQELAEIPTAYRQHHPETGQSSGLRVHQELHDHGTNSAVGRLLGRGTWTQGGQIWSTDDKLLWAGLECKVYAQWSRLQRFCGALSTLANTGKARSKAVKNKQLKKPWDGSGDKEMVHGNNRLLPEHRSTGRVVWERVYDDPKHPNVLTINNPISWDLKTTRE